MSKPQTILARDLADCVTPAPRTVRLHGGKGSVCIIEGEVYNSNVMKDCVVPETDLGTLYLPAENKISISLLDPELHPERLHQVNDAMASFLADEFDWYAEGPEDDEALDNLSHKVGVAVSDLISATSE